MVLFSLPLVANAAFIVAAPKESNSDSEVVRGEGPLKRTISR